MLKLFIDMKGSLNRINPPIRGKLHLKMETSIRGNGFRGKHQGLEYSHIKMGQPTRAIGRTICRMGLESKNGRTSASTRAILKMG